jgi:hypothetical protein
LALACSASNSVTAALRVCVSEFGRVAMSNQAVVGGEVLNIRWANDDPNPVAKRAIERSNADAVGTNVCSLFVVVLVVVCCLLLFVVMIVVVV